MHTPHIPYASNTIATPPSSAETVRALRPSAAPRGKCRFAAAIRQLHLQGAAQQAQRPLPHDPAAQLHRRDLAGRATSSSGVRSRAIRRRSSRASKWAVCPPRCMGSSLPARYAETICGTRTTGQGISLTAKSVYDCPSSSPCQLARWHGDRFTNRRLAKGLQMRLHPSNGAHYGSCRTALSQMCVLPPLPRSSRSEALSFRGEGLWRWHV
jgi:hypothetical protein